MDHLITPQKLYLSPDGKTLTSERPDDWYDLGYTKLANVGQSISPRIQLQFGITVVSDQVIIAHELDERYLPTEEDHEDMPATVFP